MDPFGPLLDETTDTIQEALTSTMALCEEGAGPVICLVRDTLHDTLDDLFP